MERTGTRRPAKIDDHARTALPALSCLSGFPPHLRRFGPMANLQVINSVFRAEKSGGR
jgi:hypothetical protein